MKLTKKKVFVAAIALCLIAIISAGTLAWFQASDEVTNKFMIADSDQDGTPDFSVDVWENDPADPEEKDTDGVTYNSKSITWDRLFEAVEKIENLTDVSVNGQ